MDNKAQSSSSILDYIFNVKKPSHFMFKYIVFVLLLVIGALFATMLIPSVKSRSNPTGKWACSSAEDFTVTFTETHAITEFKTSYNALQIQKNEYKLDGELVKFYFPDQQEFITFYKFRKGKLFLNGGAAQDFLCRKII